MSAFQIDGWRILRWYKSTHNGIRYYTARLHQDLWGDWILTRTWGRKGTRLGRSIDILCESYEDGVKQLEIIKSRRKQHGYTRSFPDF